MGAPRRMPHGAVAAKPADGAGQQVVASQIRQHYFAATSALADGRVWRAWMRTRTGRAVWSALDCLPGACDEIDRLTWLLAVERRGCQNLAAAGRAALAAADEGERDPLYYLRDELHAQGLLVGRKEDPR